MAGHDLPYPCHPEPTGEKPLVHGQKTLRSKQILRFSQDDTQRYQDNRIRRGENFLIYSPLLS